MDKDRIKKLLKVALAVIAGAVAVLLAAQGVIQQILDQLNNLI